MKIEMIGYNDAKTIAIYSCIKIMPFFLSSLIISFLCLIPTFIFRIYELAFVFIFPVLLIFIIIFQYIININYKEFLKGTKVRHKFVFENSSLYKDGKKIKNIENIRLYKLKKYLFLELDKSYYRISNNDFLIGSREEFLNQLRFYPNHYIAFNLPFKTDKEIIEILFNEINLENKERLFYSKDKKRVIYIYKNSVGSYSINYEKIFIAYDEERYYSGKYGWWEVDYNNSTPSFYGTIDEAFNDIKNEIQDFIEYK